MIRPPASKILQSWGLGSDFEAISDTSLSTFFRDLYTGRVATKNVAIDVADSPDWGTDRPVAQQLLYDRAVEAGSEFIFSSTVQDVQDSTERASVTIKDGQTHPADLILVADGIRSRIRSKILSPSSEPLDPIVSNITLYGIRPSLDQLRSDKDAKSLIDSVNLNIWMGRNLQVVGRMSNKLARFGAFFGILAEYTDQKGLWDEDGDIEQLRSAFASAEPALRGALRVSTTCDRWKLAEMPHLSRWTSREGRIVLLGDSAHAMLPNAAHGFSQIVEDIGALSYLFENERSLGIPTITDIWQTIRIPRVNRIKEFAAWNTRVFLGEENAHTLISKSSADHAKPTAQVKSFKTLKPDARAPFYTAAFLKWAQDYDAVGEVKKYLEKSRAKI
jgi:salicylate hydroxylase